MSSFSKYIQNRKTLIIIFCALVLSSILVTCPILIPICRNLPFLMTSWIIFSLLGIILIIITLKQKITGYLKLFLILTGTSSIGFLISVLLHNFVYGFFIYLFGEKFWEGIGMPDEPLFFIIAIFICPIAFLIGVVGSSILLIKKK